MLHKTGITLAIVSLFLVTAICPEVNTLDYGIPLSYQIRLSCPGIGERELINESLGPYQVGTIKEITLALSMTDLLACTKFRFAVYSDDFIKHRQNPNTKGISKWASWQAYSADIPMLKFKNGSTSYNSSDAGVRYTNRLEFYLPLIQNSTETEGPSTNFNPQLDSSQFWVLKENQIDLEELKKGESKTVNLTVHVEINTFESYQFCLGLQQNAKSNPLMLEASEQIKYLLVKNSKNYLIFFFFTIILHLVLQSLAFKNDIQYWKNVKNFRGVSMTLIWWDLATGLVQMLYVFVNDAPIMNKILLSLVMVSSVYRVAKVYQMRLIWSFPFVWLQKPDSYKGQTNTIESKVIGVLLLILAPCFAAFFIYQVSTIDVPLTSWVLLKQILGASMKFVAATEFARLAPQLYLNFKLKSVPVMPWRTLAYKFVDAIIDDISNYAMGSPMLIMIIHLNDDVAFIILIFQRWLYKEDSNRFEGDAQVIQADKVESNEETSELKNTETIEEKKEK